MVYKVFIIHLLEASLSPFRDPQARSSHSVLNFKFQTTRALPLLSGIVMEGVFSRKSLMQTYNIASRTCATLQCQFVHALALVLTNQKVKFADQHAIMCLSATKDGIFDF